VFALADGPAADRVEKMQLYGWLVGDWRLDAVYHDGNGQRQRTTGEAHFTWALGGRAIQDVWIVPALDVSPGTPPFRAAFHGTTLRVYDPETDLWHVVWIDPIKQMYRHMIGRRQGQSIVQDETDARGTKHRWTFSDIQSNSFRWRAEQSEDAGQSWTLQAELFVERSSKR
jgi:hypothetical protein